MMRFPRYNILLTLLLLFTISSCFGQYYFKHYQVDDGLIHNAVTTIIQDRTGMIWVGTRGGLNRFDGYSFKAYKNNNDQFGTLGNDAINCIAEDKKGMIWIATGKGLFKYNPFTEILTELATDPKEYTNNLVIDKDNNLWFLIKFSLYKYIQAEDRVVSLKIKGSCLALDSNMNVWMGDDDGNIHMYDPNEKPGTRIRIVDKSLPANARSISKIYQVPNKQLLIGCFKQGLKSYDTKTGMVRSLSLDADTTKDIFVRDIAADHTGHYWIATEQGIYIYNLATNKSTCLRKRAGDPYALADNAVYTICQDNQGGMWAGTFFGGLNYYSKVNARFEKYYPLPGANAISGNAVREICADSSGHLWIGTEDAGINKLDLKTGIFTSYTDTGKKAGISYSNIHGLLPWGRELFIGPFLQGMEIMDMHTGLITERFKLISDSIGRISDFVISFHRTRSNKLLVGTAYRNAGLFEYDRQHKTFRRIKEIPYNTYIFDIFEDSKGNIWTGSVKEGALYYNPTNGQHGNIRFGDTTKGHTINEFPVYKIFEDSEHALWFATTGCGLIKLSPDRKTTKRYTTANGLPGNVLYSILEDDDKHLWISSSKGLISFNLHNEQVKVYTKANGLITDQFNYNSAYKHSDGKMYFGSVKGMIAFDPTQFNQREPSPPTYITGFQINNIETIPGANNSPLSKSILYTDTITLNYDQNNFNIEFAALNYSSPEATRYKYLMKGIDQPWTYLTTNRKAYFTDLSHGTYEFVVHAESNTGSWEGEERHLVIKILPPLWKSRMAYMLYLLLSGTVVMLMARLYRQYLERKNLRKVQLFEHEKEKEIYQAKIEFFTGITHEIQTPLTLIAGPIEWLLKKFSNDPAIRNSLTIAERNTRRLTELTNQLLDFRKTEVSQFSLNFVKTDIIVLISDLLTSFTEQAARNKIALETVLPEKHFFAFVDREAFVKICSNILSNAVKYATQKAIVNIHPVNDTDEYFTIRFHNDGNGIPKEFRDEIFKPFVRVRDNDKPGTGIGLSLAKSLTELHNGSLRLISAETDLVIFELQLPIHQKFEFQLSSYKKIK